MHQVHMHIEAYSRLPSIRDGFSFYDYLLVPNNHILPNMCPTLPHGRARTHLLLVYGNNTRFVSLHTFIFINVPTTSSIHSEMRTWSYIFFLLCIVMTLTPKRSLLWWLKIMLWSMGDAHQLRTTATEEQLCYAGSRLVMVAPKARTQYIPCKQLSVYMRHSYTYFCWLWERHVFCSEKVGEVIYVM